MSQESLYLAITLHERLALLRTHSGFVPGNLELGQKRLERWKSAFEEEVLYQGFLNSEGMTEAEFRTALALDGRELQELSGTAPEWMARLEELLATGPMEPDHEWELRWGRNAEAFLVLFTPLLHHYRSRVRAGAENLARDLIAADSLVASLFDALAARLARLCQKTLILETNIARVENRTIGSTPEERFESFLRLVREPAARRAILEEYPVLARKVLAVLDQWASNSEEFLRRFAHDRPELLQQLFDEDPGRLVAARAGAGDMHRQGRTVHILQFERGAKLVYKPRSMHTDTYFDRAVAWLNARGQEPQLRLPRVLDRGEYGWAEFVSYESCQEPAEVDRFFERQGAWLALFTLTATNDMHLENMLASGEHPVPVDLETVFHPVIFRREPQFADELASERIMDSVMSVGLLPSPAFADGRAVDKSGLGATPNQVLPFHVDGAEGMGTDEVRIAKVPARIGQTQNQPRLNGNVVELTGYHACVLRGFKNTYRLLEAGREDWTGHGGFLDQARELVTRVVIRHSSFYASILAESVHPSLNRNAADQDLVIKELWRIVTVAGNFAATIPSERRQLLCGDIPYFFNSPDSLDLVGGDGAKVPAVMARAGLEVARQRFARMGSEDLAGQSWLLEASLTSSVAASGARPVTRSAPPNFRDPLEGAVRVGERLIATAVRHGGTATWICLNYRAADGLLDEERHRYELGLVEGDLYRGSLGIGLFLAYLHRATGDLRFKTIAEEALLLARERIGRLREKRLPGGFSGLAGYLYTFLHAGILWERGDLLEAAIAELGSLEEFIGEDKRLDVILGTAGSIPVLNALARACPRSHAREVSLVAGDRLLAVAARRDGRLRWPGLHVPRGFSHGHAGVAWALSELAWSTGEGRFLVGAADALAIDRELLAGGPWSDIPGNPEGMAWCHGAPGIALGRLRMLQRRSDPERMAAALEALEKTLGGTERNDHILCHGQLGNLEPLLLAAQVFPEEARWREVRDRKIELILDDIRRKGWMSQLPVEVMEPGLMMGLAGIGWGLLRIAGAAPSVLLLDPPLT